MTKKESYRHILPHFQQSGQAYFITWNLKDAIPLKALHRYSSQLEILKSQLKSCNPGGAANSDSLIQKCGSESASPGNSSSQSAEPKINADWTQRFGSLHPKAVTPEIESIQKEYYNVRKKYIKAYNDLLDMEKNPTVDLSKPQNTKAIIDSLKFFEGKRIENFAFCVMPNHVHWVIKLFEKDEFGKPVYLEDILYSVKRFSANQINKLENRKGSLWQKESFDTTIRDDIHLYYAVEYTLNNPVNAGFVADRNDWGGNFLSSNF